MHTIGKKCLFKKDTIQHIQCYIGTEKMYLLQRQEKSVDNL